MIWHSLFIGTGMHKIIIVIAAFVFFGSTPLFSQGDSTKYINGLPVSEDDTAIHEPQRDFEPHNRLRPVTANSLPAKLREILDEEEVYQGWEDTTIYYEKNTDLYIVPIRHRNSVKIFGLTENGDPVTFSEVTNRQ